MNINDIVAYVIKNYPRPDELSKARLNKIIYLIDWKSILLHGKPITSIQWVYNHYGPYVNDIEESLIKDERFSFKKKSNIYGNEKTVIELINQENFIEPTSDEKEVIDFIIEKTKKFNFNNFIKLVYSTYPIISQPQGSTLNLIELANEYKNLQKNENN